MYYVTRASAPSEPHNTLKGECACATIASDGRRTSMIGLGLECYISDIAMRNELRGKLKQRQEQYLLFPFDLHVDCAIDSIYCAGAA